MCESDPSLSHIIMGPSHTSARRIHFHITSCYVILYYIRHIANHRHRPRTYRERSPIPFPGARRPSLAHITARPRRVPGASVWTRRDAERWLCLGGRNTQWRLCLGGLRTRQVEPDSNRETETERQRDSEGGGTQNSLGLSPERPHTGRTHACLRWQTVHGFAARQGTITAQCTLHRHCMLVSDGPSP
jgi:hypothetical protein